MTPEVTTSHATEAAGLLTSMFQDKVVINGILASLMVPVDELESVFWDIINKRLITNSPTGDQLDQLGAIVGESRGGRGDAEYLLAIRIRLRVNRSQGLTVDLIDIMILTGLDFSYWEASDTPAFFNIDVYSVTYPAALGAIIKEARSAGVRGTVTYTSRPRAPVTGGGHTSMPGIWGVSSWSDQAGTSSNLTYFAAVEET